MLVAHGSYADLPGYDALTFPLMPVGSTSECSVQELGFASICLLTPLRRLYPLPVRQASVLPTASSRFRLATDTLAVQLTLPLAGCVEDFHLQVSAPCRAHKLKAACSRRPLSCASYLWGRRDPTDSPYESYLAQKLCFPVPERWSSDEHPRDGFLPGPRRSG
jgi:hypothetical protein